MNLPLMIGSKRRFQIRYMSWRDHADVMLIEKASFDHPWTSHDLSSLLAQFDVRAVVSYIDQVVCGFMVYRGVGGCFEILNIAVHEDYRRMGIGKEFIARLISMKRTKLLDLFVHEKNLVSQLFFSDCGFIADEVVSNHFNEGSTAYHMVLRKEWI